MFHCFACTQTFHFSEKFVAHVAILHSDKVRAGDLKCGVSPCGLSFDRMRTFSRHSQSHEKKIKLDHDKETQGASSKYNVVHSDSCVSIVDVVNECDIVQSGAQGDNHSLEFSLSDYEMSLTNAVFGLLGKLYSFDTIPRSHVQLIVEGLMEFVSGPHIEILESETLKALSGSENPKIAQLFHSFKNMFSGLETEHKRFKAFEDSGAYIKPKPYTVGFALDAVNPGRQARMQPISLHGQFIPMREVLKGYLELPDVLSGILAYIDELESKDGNVLENFIQGTLWKEIIKPKFPRKTVLPLNLYYDEFDPSDTSGAHAGTHKVGGLYYTLACIPPQYSSCLDSIFVSALIYGQDIAFGVQEAFSLVLEEIRYLETTGITVVTKDNECCQIYFALCLFLGDNLGVHQVLGFAGGFRANYFCRMCKAHRNVTETMTSLNLNLMRTRATYETDVAANAMSATGIKSKCIWNQFTAYHCIDNACYDLMHDLDEGAWDYDMCLLISELIKRKRFSLETLNNRVQGFAYGACEASNKPGIITDEHLKKQKFRFTAAEKLCFVRYFGLIVGDLIEEEDERLWHFYQVIHEIILYLTSPIIVIDDLVHIDALIREHHIMYLELFPKVTLKPKHHNMLHYTQVILRVGPLSLLSCWRFEAKHRQFQRAARSQTNYINLLLTLATKHQLKLCQRFLSGRGFEKRYESSSAQSIPMSTLKGSTSFCHLLPGYLNTVAPCLNWVKINGTLYLKGMVLLVKLDDEYPVFAEIVHILQQNDGKSVYFILKGFETIVFCQKFLAYQVENSNSWFVKSYNTLVKFYPTVSRIGPNGQRYVTYRHKL